MTSSCLLGKVLLPTLGIQRYRDDKADVMAHVIGEDKLRRSLRFVNDVDARGFINANSVTSVRLGFELAPKYSDDVVGRTVAHDIRLITLFTGKISLLGQIK